MGHVYQRGSKWYVCYKLPDGREKRESAQTSRESDAKRFLKRREREMDDLRFSGRPMETDIRLEDFKKEYLTYVEANKEETSDRRDKGILANHLIPAFGHMKMREIRPRDVQRYIDRRGTMKRPGGKPVAAQTIRNEVYTLSAMFREAIRRELLSFNPVSRVKLPKEDNTIVRWLTDDEEKALWDELPDRVKPIAMTAMHCGLRVSEVFRLKWTDIDMEQRLLVVKRNKGKRKLFIPINDVFYDVLKGLPRSEETSLVFPSYKTKDEYDNIDTAWRGALERSGVEEFRFHDLRHTFASRLRQAGVDITVIKELLGHRDLATTQRYAHLSPKDLRDAVQMLVPKARQKEVNEQSEKSDKSQKAEEK